MKEQLNFRQDSDLSLKAKAILYYSLEMPEGHRFSGKSLEKTVLDARCAIKSGLKELELSGYLFKEKYRTKQGKLYGWDYIFSENALRKEQFKLLKEERDAS